jgi:CRP-like cAMP-binding protein
MQSETKAFFMLSHADIEKTQESVFLGSLPKPVFETIIAHGTVIKLNPGEELFQQGQPADAMFVVLEGLVKLSSR